MAKVIKGSKRDLLDLLDAVDKLPAAKAASDVEKHVSFRRALKKTLKDYIDFRADSIAGFQAKRKEAQEEVQKLTAKIEKETDEEKKKLAESQKEKVGAEFQKETNLFTSALEIKMEELKKDVVEVTFDNEAFLFANNIIKESVADAFKTADGSLDNDKLDIVLGLFESAK